MKFLLQIALYRSPYLNLPLASTPLRFVVRVGPASIELQKGFDPQLLREAVEALSSSC